MIASESTAGSPFSRSTVSTVRTSVPENLAGRNTRRQGAARRKLSLPTPRRRSARRGSQPRTAGRSAGSETARGRVHTTTRAVRPVRRELTWTPRMRSVRTTRMAAGSLTSTSVRTVTPGSAMIRVSRSGWGPTQADESRPVGGDGGQAAPGDGEYARPWRLDDVGLVYAHLLDVGTGGVLLRYRGRSEHLGARIHAAQRHEDRRRWERRQRPGTAAHPRPAVADERGARLEGLEPDLPGGEALLRG